MLPLRDTIRSTSFPIVNWTLIALNVLVFFFEVSLPARALDQLILTYGVVPARLNLLNPLALLANPLPLVTLITHMFLHGGWVHILSNMWVLYIFGDNVEDRMGSGRYLGFYLLSGLVAALAQVALAPLTGGDQVPSIGASGAIAGVMGAYLLMYPQSRVITLILLFFIPWFVEIPAIFFLGFWFISQLFSGLTSLNLSQTAQVGGIAFWAHIGGFAFGMIFHRLFIPRRPPAYLQRYPDDYYPW